MAVCRFFSRKYGKENVRKKLFAAFALLFTLREIKKAVHLL